VFSLPILHRLGTGPLLKCISSMISFVFSILLPFLYYTVYTRYAMHSFRVDPLADHPRDHITTNAYDGESIQQRTRE
jgi:hypothetical protein